LITTDDGEELDDKLIQPYLKEKLIAIISATKPTETFVTSCTERHIQVIAYNRNWNIPTTSSVACDHRMGGEMIAQLFIEKGHQHIGLIKGPTGSYVSQQRCKGFLDQLKKTAKVKTTIEDGFFTYEGGQKAAGKLLQNKNLTAIFCADDTMAFGCLDFIKEKTKLKIPHQIEVIGYDDISVASWDSYNLTTIRQPIRQMAKLTTQLIGDYLRDPEFEPVNHLIQGRLIHRKTTG
jgi:DNA-binding LacI/PurR family transcriptional regulator